MVEHPPSKLKVAGSNPAGVANMQVHASSPADPFHDRPDLSRAACALYFAGFFLMAWYAFYSNLPCLFFDWDGAAWAVLMDSFEHFSNWYSFAQVDPLRGMFDINYQAYRGSLPHSIIASALGTPSLNKTLTYLFYSMFLLVSIFMMGRVAGLSRMESALGALGYQTLMVPLYFDTGLLNPLFALNPHYAFIVGAAVATVALYWGIDDRSRLRAAAQAIAVIFLLLVVAWSFALHFPDVVMIAIIFGIASLFAARQRSDLWAKVIAACAITAALVGAGIVNYLYDLGSSIAHPFFPELGTGRGFMPLPDVLRPFDMVLADFNQRFQRASPGGWWLIGAGLMGAVYLAARRTTRSLRAFSYGYIGFVIFFIAANLVTAEYWRVLTGQTHYYGPIVHKLDIYVFAFAVLFASALAWAVLRAAANGAVALAIALSAWSRTPAALARKIATPKFGHPRTSAPAHRGVGGRHWIGVKVAFGGGIRARAMIVHLPLIAAIAIPASLALAHNPGATQKRCNRPFFSPLERNAVIDYLVPRIALDIGRTFRGSVVTYTGEPREGDRMVWVNHLTTDHSIWFYSGNDLRTIGLWQYRLPTLEQVNVAMSPAYFLTVAELLSDTGDHQGRNFIGITRIDEKFLSLWGVRYVIADRALPLGTQRLEMAVELSNPPLYGSPIRLYEFADPNLGQYSPTEVVVAHDATQTLAVLKRAGFDGRRTAVTDTQMRGSFVGAHEASITLIKGGFALRARSGGESILVLPVQYSHCWVADSPEIVLFRANLMQLGVRFSGEIAVDISYQFGPFWHSSCRHADARDAERLKMSAARTPPKR